MHSQSNINKKKEVGEKRKIAENAVAKRYKS